MFSSIYGVIAFAIFGVVATLSKLAQRGRSERLSQEAADRRADRLVAQVRREAEEAAAKRSSARQP